VGAFSDASTRYLYLRGASRSGLPPYGLAEVLRLPPPERSEVVLVEGLIDVHHLRAEGLRNVAAIGGARVQRDAIARLQRLGFDSVVLAFDNDPPGREGMSRAVDTVSRLQDAPTLRVIDPGFFADSKDPDAFVQEHGMETLGHDPCAPVARQRAGPCPGRGTTPVGECSWLGESVEDIAAGRLHREDALTAVLNKWSWVHVEELDEVADAPRFSVRVVEANRREPRQRRERSPRSTRVWRTAGARGPSRGEPDSHLDRAGGRCR
jgi:hypothetical protein